jgi:hypothetical protein
MPNKFGKHIFIVLLLLGTGYTTFAQHGRGLHIPQQQHHEQVMDRQEARTIQKPENRAFQKSAQLPRIQSLRETFIHKQLDLPSEQSEKFAPLYHQYLQELGNVYRLKKLNNSEIQTNSSDQVNRDLLYDGQIVEIRKRYLGEFFKIMPGEKVSLLLKSERDFNQALVKEVTEKKAAIPAGTSPPPN